MSAVREFLSGSAFFAVGLSVFGYLIGLAAKKKVKSAIANPLLIAIAVVVAALWLTGVDYEAYRAGAQPLSYLLTPATVCLAVPLYSQLGQLRRCWKAAAAGVAAGVLVNMLCVLGGALLFKFSHVQYVTVMPKSVTTAIGIAVSAEFGGIQSVTVASIIVTGIFGNIAAEHILNAARVYDPVARGLAIGVGAHVVGTARALELGEVEGAMSSLAIVLTGFLTVALAPIFVNFA